MVLLSNLVLVISVIAGLLYLRKEKNKRLVPIYLLLLLITPWVWILIFNIPTFEEQYFFKPYKSVLGSFELMLSFERIFFRSNEKLFYITGDLGYFLPSFLPLVITGLWGALEHKKSRLIISFLSLLVCSAILSFFIGYLAFLLFIPVLSVFAAKGLLIFIESAKREFIYRAFFLAFLLFIIYEGIRLFRVIQVQYTLR